MSQSSSAASGGVGFTGLLTLVFVAAKLWDKIDWAWIWVFSPLWGGVALVLAVIAAMAMFAGFAWVCGAIAEIPRARRRKRARDLRNIEQGIPKIPKSW